MIVTARSPQEIRRQRRIALESEGCETSPRFHQEYEGASGPYYDAYRALLRATLTEEQSPC